MGLTLSPQTRRELIQQMEPRYREASVSQKGTLLDEIAATTGYARRYAMRLLNHPPQVQHTPRRQRQPTFGPEVQHALFTVWQAANQICSKRLMPFLPTLIETLERQGHLQLTEACRSQLLSMSAATADRLLRAPRTQGPHGLCTTRAGTLLKQQISIRTFEQWNETQPGFLEADLVAHCGVQLEGSFLYTLTLTDIATQWTECLPLLSKSAEAVVSALEQARACFPFPILGLDVDNGAEFINEHLFAYCQTKQITFTRGREGLKNDQCYVEQKNGAIVRQVAGYGRLEGERAYQQLSEMYQALRLYVNGFQPSMKLQAKHYDGRKVRRVYDIAKTPLQRLQLSGVLSASKAHELQRVVQVLDPLRLLHHLQDLQRALLDSTMNASLDAEGTAPVAVLPFCIQQCIAQPGAATPATTSKAMEGSWQEPEIQVIQGGVPEPVTRSQPEQVVDRPAPSPCINTCVSSVIPSQPTEEAGLCLSQPTAEQEATPRPATTNGVAAQSTSVSSEEQSPASYASSCCQQSRQRPLRKNLQRPVPHDQDTTIEQAVQDYLQDQSRNQRRPKTLEWHETALNLFQHYLLTEHQCIQLVQLTEARVRDWVVALPHLPTTTGSPRSMGTVESYVRSAQAFCQWLVRYQYLHTTPFAHLPLPRAGSRVLRLLEPEEWEHLLQACHLPGETGVFIDRAVARNHAILWILFETGMHVTEVCALRLGDVDREQGTLSIRGKGPHARQLMLGHEGRRHLLAYLDGYRLREATRFERKGANSEPLFLSETGRPLTKSAITLLFGRLRKRAGMRKDISASILRESFMARYLQAGGDPHTLRELLGLHKGIPLSVIVEQVTM